MALNLGTLTVHVAADIKNLSKNMASAEKQIGEAGKNLTRTVKTTGAAAEKTVAQTGRAVADAGRNAAKGAKQAESALAQTEKRLRNVGEKFERAGATLTKAVAVPLLAVGGLSAKAAIDFESAFAGVRKTVDATEEQFAELQRGLRDLALPGKGNIPLAATQLAGIAESAGQLGIQRQNILGFTETMAKLGATTNLAGDEAATALARYANIMQTSQDQFDEMGSAIVDLGNNLATTERELVEMGLRLAGAGKQVGLTEAQVFGLAGALSSVGIEAEAGGTALSRVMLNIQNAIATGDKQVQLFAAVAGKSTQEFADAFKRDAAGAITEFVEGLGKLSKAGGNTSAVLEQLGMDDIRVRDALLRLSNAGDLTRRSIDLASKSYAENSALNKEFAERVKTTAAQWQLFKNEVVDVGITLGNSLLPALRDVFKALRPTIEAIGRAAERFANLDEDTQRAYLKLALFVAAIGPALSAVGKLVGGLANLAGLFGMGGVAGKAATAGGAVKTFGTLAMAARGGVLALVGAVGIYLSQLDAIGRKNYQEMFPGLPKMAALPGTGIGANIGTKLGRALVGRFGTQEMKDRLARFEAAATSRTTTEDIGAQLAPASRRDLSAAAALDEHRRAVNRANAAAVESTDEVAKAYAEGQAAAQAYIDAINAAMAAMEDGGKTAAAAGSNLKSAADDFRFAISDAGLVAARRAFESARAGGNVVGQQMALSIVEQAQAIRGMQAGGIPAAAYQTAPAGAQATVDHTGTIRVEGVNTRGELVGVTEIIAEDIATNQQRYPAIASRRRAFE